MTAAQSGLAARAVRAARQAHHADPDGFPERHQDWHTWQRRAQLARTLASILGVPAEQVRVINDPHRVYGTVPGDLLIITNPDTNHKWHFVPDLGGTETFLFLDDCPACDATVPLTRLATLADLGAYLDTDDPGYDPAQGCPDEFPDDPAHHPDCDLAHPDHWRSRHADSQRCPRDCRAAGPARHPRTGTQVGEFPTFTPSGLAQHPRGGDPLHHRKGEHDPHLHTAHPPPCRQRRHDVPGN